MGRHAALVNDPMKPPAGPDGTRPTPRRRYHYITVSVEADPEVVAEQCNRKAGEGYTLAGTVAVPRTGRTEVMLTFYKRLRRRSERPVAAVPSAPPAQAVEAPPPAAEVEVSPGLTVREV